MANRKGVLFIPCENMAAWMSLNNTFSGGPYRQGIMVQLGDRRRHNSTRYMKRFRSIIFRYGNSERLVLSRKEFGSRAKERILWINIFPARHDNPVTSPKSNKNSKILRVANHRSLRTFFKPVAHLICWNAPSGITITARPHRGHDHNSYTFALGGPLEVQIIYDSLIRQTIRTLDRVQTITVSSTEDGSVPDDGGDDGNGEDPPQQRKP